MLEEFVNEYYDDTHQYESYEVYFAQQLGVQKTEQIFSQLMAVAKVALYDLPDGWSMGIYEDADNQDLKIPYFYDNITNISQWSHPYQEKYSNLIYDTRSVFLRLTPQLGDVYNSEENSFDRQYENPSVAIDSDCSSTIREQITAEVESSTTSAVEDLFDAISAKLSLEIAETITLQSLDEDSWTRDISQRILFEAVGVELDSVAESFVREETQSQLILEVIHRVVKETAEITASEAVEQVVREKVERMARVDDERAARKNKRKAREEAERLAANDKLVREKSERDIRYEAERLAIEESKKVARERAERLVREEAEKLAKEKAELFSRMEAERLAREEAEEKAKLAAEREARAVAEREAREEAERLAREEAERDAREEAERLAREEAERDAREEAERDAREAAEWDAREEVERLAREDAREEAERLAREEAERDAREEVERLAREEAERHAREEAERLAREEAERDAREEAERLAREDAREEAERLAREEAERDAREEVERLAREDAREEAERLAREEAERDAREEVERLAREEAERDAREEVERLAREEADRLEREEAEEKAKLAAEREARAVAEREAREEADRLAREEAERDAREEAERLAREEAEREAREEAERLAREEVDRLAREEAGREEREEAERLAKEEADELLNEIQGRQEADMVIREEVEIRPAREKAETLGREEANGAATENIKRSESVVATALDEERWDDYSAKTAKESYNEKDDDECDDLQDGELSVHDKEIEGVVATALSRDLDGDVSLEKVNQKTVGPTAKGMGDVRDMFLSLFTPSLPIASTQTQSHAALHKHADLGNTKSHNSKKKSGRTKRTDLNEMTKISNSPISDKKSSKSAADVVHLSAHPQSQVVGHEARVIDEKLMRLLNEKVWFSLGSYSTLAAAKAARREVQHIGQGVKVRVWRDSSRQCWVLDTNSQGLKCRRQVGPGGQDGITMYSPSHPSAPSVSSSFIATEKDASEKTYSEVDGKKDDQEGQGVASLKLPRIQSMSARVITEGDTGSNKASLRPLPSISRKGET